MPNSNTTPQYAILRNGKPFYITGSISTAYPKPLAENIINLLNQVADDDYSLQLITWSDLKSEQECFYQVLCNGEVMRTNKNSISEAYSHRHAVDIIHYLNKVSDDNFSLKLSNLGESGAGKVTSFVDTWNDDTHIETWARAGTPVIWQDYDVEGK